MNCDFNFHNNSNVYNLELFLGSIHSKGMNAKRKEVEIIQENN